MKRSLAFLLIFTLSACENGTPVDCRAVYRKIPQCLDRAASDGSKFRWDECIPYSRHVIISGVWASAFEFNEFREGAFADQSDPWHVADVSTRLDLDRPAHKNAAGENIGTVSQISFIGRRPLCVVTPEESWLIVDRVLSEEVIATAPYDT